MSKSITKEFDWVGELNQSFIKSLTTTFGLDFLLLEDKKGGDVDTVHNVRQGIYATAEAEKAYQSRGEYNSKDYHTDKNYIGQGKKDKLKQADGKLYDPYREQYFGANDSRQLDHTISANEIHNDAGRVLAGLDGIELANQFSNLNSTQGYLNNVKKEISMQEFVAKIPEKIKTKQDQITKAQEKLSSMPENTPEERDKKRRIEDEIRKNQEHIAVLKSANPEAMLAADKKAREMYNWQINKAYYTSSKFLKNTAFTAMDKGVRMGVRQSLGIILAEVWFELKEQLPQIYADCKENFEITRFLTRIIEAINNIWQRIKTRFRDLLESFMDGAIGGVISSIVTTVTNIVFTTTKLLGKLIRETWNSLVQAAKLIFFNPNNLPTGDLIREVTKILSFGAATFIGVIINQHLNQFFAFQFGDLLADFLGAFSTAVLTIGLTFFLEHSAVMQKVWEFLNSLKSKYQRALEHYQEINQALDQYLLELAKIEFNLNPQELEYFSDQLVCAADDFMQLGSVLDKEIDRREIELPYQSGDVNSVRSWLKSKQGK